MNCCSFDDKYYSEDLISWNLQAVCSFSRWKLWIILQTKIFAFKVLVLNFWTPTTYPADGFWLSVWIKSRWERTNVLQRIVAVSHQLVRQPACLASDGSIRLTPRNNEVLSVDHLGVWVWRPPTHKNPPTTWLRSGTYQCWPVISFF